MVFNVDMTTSSDTIERTYRQRRDDYANAASRGQRQSQLLTHLRLMTFLLGLLLFGLGWISGQGGLWYAIGGLVAIIFFALVVVHERIQVRLQRDRVLQDINAEAIARLHRDWAALPESPVDVPPQHRAVVEDLDLIGHASLYHLLCAANTPAGTEVLRDWLLEPARPDEIRLRQQAVAELAPELELRETLDVAGRLLGKRGSATAQFVDWAEGEPWLTGRRWLLWVCRLVPAIGVFSLVLLGLQWISGLVAAVVILAVLSVNFLISVFFVGNVHDIFARIRTRRGDVQRYLGMFQLMYSMPDSTTELDAIKREATELDGGVLLRLTRLSLISRLAAIHHSAMLFIFVYLPLQFLLLYDFHVLALLEGWQMRHGPHVRRWFLALGKFEALCSLANLSYDHPQWTFPEVSDSADRFVACGLGHPLLEPSACVTNDVDIGSRGSFLLVTGSNMSGKSTLLRAVGLNAVLAQAGASVNAERLQMPPVTLATSIRVRDSLEDGVSFYMAELMRLKQIVDLARDADRRGGRMLMYLLDEILLGTNSRERHIAVIRVLQWLLKHDTIGAISTHDLELAASEPLTTACHPVHFRETLHDRDAERPMTFDYQLRSGVATTTNALKLLEIVGLGGE